MPFSPSLSLSHMEDLDVKEQLYWNSGQTSGNQSESEGCNYHTEMALRESAPVFGMHTHTDRGSHRHTKLHLNNTHSQRGQSRWPTHRKLSVCTYSQINGRNVHRFTSKRSTKTNHFHSDKHTFKTVAIQRDEQTQVQEALPPHVWPRVMKQCCSWYFNCEYELPNHQRPNREADLWD